MKLVTPLFKKPYIELENEQERELFNLDKDKEIERLKESEEYYKKGFTELHKRIEEAIEYLDAVNKSNQKMFVLVDKQHLLDILKGDDNNE